MYCIYFLFALCLRTHAHANLKGTFKIYECVGNFKGAHIHEIGYLDARPASDINNRITRLSSKKEMKHAPVVCTVIDLATTQFYFNSVTRSSGASLGDLLHDMIPENLMAEKAIFNEEQTKKWNELIHSMSAFDQFWYKKLESETDVFYVKNNAYEYLFKPTEDLHQIRVMIVNDAVVGLYIPHKLNHFYFLINQDVEFLSVL